MGVRPAKTQISLGIRPVWSESLLCAQWVAEDPRFLHADSEDSDQMGGCPGWSESSLRAQPFCWFFMSRLKSPSMTTTPNKFLSNLTLSYWTKYSLFKTSSIIMSRSRACPRPYEPRQANLCLRAFRHDKFQLRMSSHSDGPRIWLSVWKFLLIHCLYERAAKVLARLRGWAGSPEPSLLAQAISTKFAWRGPYQKCCQWVQFNNVICMLQQKGWQYRMG